MKAYIRKLCKLTCLHSSVPFCPKEMRQELTQVSANLAVQCSYSVPQGDEVDITFLLNKLFSDRLFPTGKAYTTGAR